MISILIPIYNYNVSSLITTIHKQATKASDPFEIICYDDASTTFTEINKALADKLEYVDYIIGTSNIGRTAARQVLCETSNYNWLLFLDADVIPKSNSFYNNYLNEDLQAYEAFFGGFAYDNTNKPKSNALRWLYGKRYEQVKAKKRNTIPYTVIISANFLIKKSLFTRLNLQINKKAYGLDNYFAALLKKQKAKVLHVNNEVYHFGLEDNVTYIKKSEEATHTLLWMHYKVKISTNNKLLNTLLFLKRIKLNYVIALLFPILKPLLVKSLSNAKPHPYLLQLYKMLYISYTDYNYLHK